MNTIQRLFIATNKLANRPVINRPTNATRNLEHKFLVIEPSLMPLSLEGGDPLPSPIAIMFLPVMECLHSDHITDHTNCVTNRLYRGLSEDSI